jgi:hypothetical protein
MPMTLTPAGQRVRVAQLLAQCGGMTHYEVLGVASDCAEDQIHRGYTTVARLVHTVAGSEAEPRGARAGAAAALRARHARLPDAQRSAAASGVRRRDRSRHELPDEESAARRAPQPGARIVRPGARARQRRGLPLRDRAASPGGDARSDARVLRTPGGLPAAQPNWSRQALDAARAGLRLKPSDTALRLLSAQALEKCGEIDEAAEEYLSVCDRDPTQTIAAEGLGRIATERGMQVEPFLRKLRAAQKTR